MRKILFLILAMFIPVIIVALPSNGEVDLFGGHFLPSEISEGDEVDFFVMVRDTNSTGVEKVYLKLNEDEFNMKRYHDPDEADWSEGVLYQAKVKVEMNGYVNLTFHAMSGNETLISTDIITLNIDEKEEMDTILGMPKTYCAISVIFITLIIIFLTWSYFKGRRMQKEMEHLSGASGMACSACGANISLDDEKCPKCGAVFEEEEHICGNCGNVISEIDTKCSKCGTKLKAPVEINKKVSKEKGDSDLKKLKKKVDMTGKKKCKKCKTIYLAKEGKCPECGN